MADPTRSAIDAYCCWCGGPEECPRHPSEDEDPKAQGNIADLVHAADERLGMANRVAVLEAERDALIRERDEMRRAVDIAYGIADANDRDATYAESLISALMTAGLEECTRLRALLIKQASVLSAAREDRAEYGKAYTEARVKNAEQGAKYDAIERQRDSLGNELAQVKRERDELRGQVHVRQAHADGAVNDTRHVVGL